MQVCSVPKNLVTSVMRGSNMTGASQTVKYTDAIVGIVESIEKLSEGAYGQANHEIIMDNQIKIEPMKPTSADEIFMRYED